MFTGYSGETLDFLWGIRFNNERSWFLAHKEEYLRCLYQPTMELGAQAQALMGENFPKLALNLHVSRIYRDTRRLHGRGPYKDHLWFTLRPPPGGQQRGLLPRLLVRGGPGWLEPRRGLLVRQPRHDGRYAPGYGGAPPASGEAGPEAEPPERFSAPGAGLRKAQGRPFSPAPALVQQENYFHWLRQALR